VLIQFIDMTKCLAMGKPEDLVNHLKRFHVYIGEIDWESLRKDVDEFATRFRAQDIGELDYGNLINDMFALGRRYHVRPVTDMTLVFVGMITAQGIGKMSSHRSTSSTNCCYSMPVLMRRNEAIPTPSRPGPPRLLERRQPRDPPRFPDPSPETGAADQAHSCSRRDPLPGDPRDVIVVVWCVHGEAEQAHLLRPRPAIWPPRGPGHEQGSARRPDRRRRSNATSRPAIAGHETSPTPLADRSGPSKAASGQMTPVIPAGPGSSSRRSAPPAEQSLDRDQ
jgi:hypothetical protein